MNELIDRRYFAAIKCVDRATGFHLNRGMNIVGQGLSFMRNRSNLYVINGATGLEPHRDSFQQAPELPVAGSMLFSVDVIDPMNLYLPRNVEIRLPRNANPANIEDDDSLFNPINVRLYAAPNARVMANWSTVRASIMREDGVLGTVPVVGALLRVIRNSDDQIMSSGLSDERGEALVIIPGVPITEFADEDDEDSGPGRSGGSGRPGGSSDPTPVVISEIPARLEVSFDADASWPTNPDVLEVNHSANLVATENLTLRTGRMETVAIQLT